MTTGNRVVWWEIEVADTAAAQRFYGKLFDWTFRWDFDGPESQLARDYWLVEVDGCPGPAGRLGRTYLGSDDFWFANVRDPQGVSLGLWTTNP
jgi:predicted enzyme related to lactoylglutathione lyase